MASPATATRPQPALPPSMYPEGAEGFVTNGKTHAAHGFSGELVDIKIFRGVPGEDSEPFFAIGTYTCRIRRDTWVRVPVELADMIDTLEVGDQEPDPAAPDDRTRDRWVQRKRFPFERRAVTS